MNKEVQIECQSLRNDPARCAGSFPFAPSTSSTIRRTWAAKKTVARSGSLQHPVREIFLTTGCFERILTYDSLFLPRNYQQNEVPPLHEEKAPLIDTSLLNSRLILILLQRLSEDEIVEEVDELIDLRLRDLARSTELIALDAHLFTDE